MPRKLDVSCSGYHAWVKARRPSQRAETDAVLIAAIRVARTPSRGTLARHAACRACRQGHFCWLQAGCAVDDAGILAGVSRRKFVVTTIQNGGRQTPNSWLNVTSRRKRLTRLCEVADITCIPDLGRLSPDLAVIARSLSAVALSAGR